MGSGIQILDDFMHQNSFNSIFRGGGGGDTPTRREEDSSPIPGLSPLASSVIRRCSEILNIPTPQALQQQFEAEYPALATATTTTSAYYSRYFIEYASYKALHLLTQLPDYLSDKQFRRFSYDVMLAWDDSSSAANPVVDNDSETLEDEDEEWSLFYTNSITMAVQVDHNKTVGPEAFARIAPACPVIADIITVHNLFDALTTSSPGRLHFLIYDKYLGSLDKVIRTAKSASGPPLSSNLQFAEGEIVLNIDGTVPTQPVLQHIGISAWPGRLTLTNYALYFEAGVGLYDKPVRYDLAMELKQVVKPELTGPLGARLFDKAVMYKSSSVTGPVYLEFPELKGHSRRDYWLDNILEVLHAHKFIRKYNFEETQQLEALAKAVLGIFRLRAVREAFHIFPSHYKTLLDYNLAEKLPRGDIILETLSSCIKLLSTRTSVDDVRTPSGDEKKLPILSPVSLLALTKLGFVLQRVLDVNDETEFPVGDVSVGETNPLELAVKQSKCDTSRAETAQATVDQVKIDGIDTNIAITKELLFPVVESVKRLHYLVSWEDPPKSTVFLFLICYTIYRDWFKYALPFILVLTAMLMLLHKHCNEGKPLEAFRVTLPPSKNAVEQLLALQEAISQFEAFVQVGNINLLKLRALLFSSFPQATDKAILVLIVMAAMFAFIPLKILIILISFEMYTRKMPLRKDYTGRYLRRTREWWLGIPAAPVRLAKREKI